jgi:hypothetical protein
MAANSIVVVWKDEDEIDGEPVGPVGIYTRTSCDTLVPRPVDPTVPRWVTRSQAISIAAEHNAEFRES